MFDFLPALILEEAYNHQTLLQKVIAKYMIKMISILESMNYYDHYAYASMKSL